MAHEKHLDFGPFPFVPPHFTDYWSVCWACANFDETVNQRYVLSRLKYPIFLWSSFPLKFKTNPLSVWILNVNEIHFIEGEPTYPATVTVSSREGAADVQSKCLGVYKKTSKNWSGRPVWQSTVRDDRFLFYHGSNFEYI